MAEKEWTNVSNGEEEQRPAGSETAEEGKTPPAQPLDDAALEGAAGGLSGGMRTPLPLTDEGGILV